MNLNLYNYLDDRMNNERYDERGRRRNNDDDNYGRNNERNNERGYEHPNKIGFNSEFPSYEDFRDNRRSHKETDFEEEDFQEPKGMSRYTPTGTNKMPKMSMDELLEKISKSFKKEICDVLRYQEMSMAAEDAGFKEFAKGLDEMQIP